jgi:acyl-coenzyme A synthetase/AMP-(fatty) acid ligase
MADVALIHASGPDAVVAFNGGNPVSLGEFLRDVGRVQASLPDRRHVLNLCANRYEFSIVFCAAVLRGQVNLLPPSLTPHVIGQIAAGFPEVYCVGDAPPGLQGVSAFSYAQLQGERGPLEGIPRVPADRPAAVLFTSGSTGTPVPSPKSWGSLVGSATALADTFGLRDSGMALLATVPAQHMYGIEASVFLPMQGLALHSARPFFPVDICAELAALPRPRGLVTTPLHLRALLGGASHFPALDFVLSSTAALAPELAREAEKRLAAPVYEIYGCTEAGQVATRRTAVCPDWQLAPGLTLAQDVDGTRVSGGHLDTEVRLQDVIEILDGRRFRLLGRTADLVNIAGKRTSIGYLDHHLKSIEGVVDGAFLMPAGREDAVGRMMAFAVAPGLSEAVLLARLRERIDPAFVPRPLCIVDALPRNETGKLPRAALEALATQCLGK